MTLSTAGIMAMQYKNNFHYELPGVAALECATARARLKTVDDSEFYSPSPESVANKVIIGFQLKLLKSRRFSLFSAECEKPAVLRQRSFLLIKSN